MSNWRINVGLGPVRYTKPIGGKSKPEQRKKPGCVGAVVTLVVVVGVMYLCCWGGVAWMNAQP